MEVNEIRLEAQDLNQQGAMLLRTGKLEAAKAKFDKAIELDPIPNFITILLRYRQEVLDE